MIAKNVEGCLMATACVATCTAWAVVGMPFAATSVDAFFKVMVGVYGVLFVVACSGSRRAGTAQVILGGTLCILSMILMALFCTAWPCDMGVGMVFVLVWSFAQPAQMFVLMGGTHTPIIICGISAHIVTAILTSCHRRGEPSICSSGERWWMVGGMLTASTVLIIAISEGGHPSIRLQVPRVLPEFPEAFHSVAPSAPQAPKGAQGGITLHSHGAENKLDMEAGWTDDMEVAVIMEAAGSAATMSLEALWDMLTVREAAMQAKMDSKATLEALPDSKTEKVNSEV